MTPYNKLEGMIGKELMATRLMDFCKESNRIEGEDDAGYNDLAALSVILRAPKITERVLFDAHIDYAAGSRLQNHERGAWRKVQVYVGKFIPPPPSRVPELMQEYILMNEHGQFSGSWEAHCAFEKIHPFIDFNGRMGRALWLRRAIDEGYDCSIGFLHKFYYQTLWHFEKSMDRLSGGAS